MGLFDKKFCDVCGGKIGLLGNRKLTDGNLCKECASKLSPFFSERKQSSVEQIKEQLEYREANKDAVAAFHTDRSFGSNTKLYIDQTAAKFMVTSARNLAEANPDVISLSAVTGVRIDTSESKREETHPDKDGKQVSFVPPHYEYDYDISVTINVNHPYFDEIYIRVSDNISVSTIGNMTPHVENNPAFKQGMEEAEAIKAALLGAAGTSGAQAAKPVVCPHCGATTTPTANGCCEYCGSPLN